MMRHVSLFLLLFLAPSVFAEGMVFFSDITGEAGSSLRSPRPVPIAPVPAVAPRATLRGEEGLVLGMLPEGGKLQVTTNPKGPGTALLETRPKGASRMYLPSPNDDDTFVGYDYVESEALDPFPTYRARFQERMFGRHFVVEDIGGEVVLDEELEPEL